MVKMSLIEVSLIFFPGQLNSIERVFILKPFLSRKRQMNSFSLEDHSGSLHETFDSFFALQLQ